MRIRDHVISTIFLCLIFEMAYGIPKSDTLKDRFTTQYKHKYVVALREGLVVGFPADVTKPWADYAVVRVERSEIQVCPANAEPCDNVSPQPVRRGEVLYVERAGLLHNKVGYYLVVQTVSPHSIQRGFGAFAHESMEAGRAAIEFRVADPENYDSLVAEIANWLKTFDTVEEAAKFGNTASGVFVREVKLGMTFAEVERELGLPQTRVDLGDKVLYKYRDMTVEFHNGKVADVK